MFLKFAQRSIQRMREPGFGCRNSATQRIVRSENADVGLPVLVPIADDRSIAGRSELDRQIVSVPRPVAVEIDVPAIRRRTRPTSSKPSPLKSPEIGRPFVGPEVACETHAAAAPSRVAVPNTLDSTLPCSPRRPTPPTLDNRLQQRPAVPCSRRCRRRRAPSDAKRRPKCSLASVVLPHRPTNCRSLAPRMTRESRK